MELVKGLKLQTIFSKKLHHGSLIGPSHITVHIKNVSTTTCRINLKFSVLLYIFERQKYKIETFFITKIRTVTPFQKNNHFLLILSEK